MSFLYEIVNNSNVITTFVDEILKRNLSHGRVDPLITTQISKSSIGGYDFFERFHKCRNVSK